MSTLKRILDDWTVRRIEDLGPIKIEHDSKLDKAFMAAFTAIFAFAAVVTVWWLLIGGN